ncbi:pentapeptide repeat-containing protein [Asanoa iriomotensis]|nr:pentapeptide repeat-containing protein [Asanoa iriomotensis]
MRFSLSLVIALAGIGAFALVAFAALAWVRGSAVPLLPPPKTPGKPLSSAEIYDLTRSTVAVAGLAAGVFAAVYAYRKQRVEEAGSRRSDAEQLSTRYQDAADQLGNDKAAVRLAGVYGLSRLADDWPEQRQVCINVLCAYFRMHKESTAVSEGEQEVRSTIVDVLLDHLSPDHPTSWRGYEMSFRGSYIDLDFHLLDGPGEGFIDFSDAVFSGCRVVVSNPHGSAADVLNFKRATFRNGASVEIKGGWESGVIDFGGATLLDAKFDLTSLYLDGGDLGFVGASFNGANVYFSNAHFRSGQADFTKADFARGRVDFSHAQFHPGVARFAYANYGEAEVIFEDVEGEKPAGVPPAKWLPAVRNPPDDEAAYSTS